MKTRILLSCALILLCVSVFSCLDKKKKPFYKIDAEIIQWNWKTVYEKPEQFKKDYIKLWDTVNYKGEDATELENGQKLRTQIADGLLTPEKNPSEPSSMNDTIVFFLEPMLSFYAENNIKDKTSLNNEDIKIVFALLCHLPAEMNPRQTKSLKFDKFLYSKSSDIPEKFNKFISRDGVHWYNGLDLTLKLIKSKPSHMNLTQSFCNKLVYIIEIITPFSKDKKDHCSKIRQEINEKSIENALSFLKSEVKNHQYDEYVEKGSDYKDLLSYIEKIKEAYSMGCNSVF